MVLPAESILRGVDEFYNSAGVQLAPLGFGYSEDWEVIERREISAAVATVDFLFDDDTYDEIELVGYDIIPATDNVTAWVRITDDNGATYETSGYIWSNDRWGSGTARSQTNGGASGEIEIASSVGNNSGETLSLRVKILNPDSTNVKHIIGTGAAHAGNILTWESFGTHSTTSPLNGIQFLFDNSGAVNTNSGVFILRGRRKAQATLKSQDDWVVIDDQTDLSGVTTHDVFWDDQVWDEIEISVWGLVLSADVQTLNLLLSTDGSTFHSSAGNYRWVRRVAGDGDTDTVAGGSGGTDTDIELLVSLGTSTDEHMDGTMHLRNVSNTTRKKTAHTNWTGILSNGEFHSITIDGILLASNNSMRGFRLDPQGATTLSADRIRVRGRRKAPIGVLKQDWEVIEQIDIAVTGSLANLDFTDIPTSEFEEFELRFHGAETDTSVNGLSIRFSADNGSSFDSGTNYTEEGITRSAEASNSDLGALNQTEIRIVNNFGTSAVRAASGAFWLKGLHNGEYKGIEGNSLYLNDSGSFRANHSLGWWDGTGADAPITAFRLLLDAGGNFTAGVFTLRGRRKL